MYLSCAPQSQPEKTQKPDSLAWLNTNPPARMGGARACFFFNVPPSVWFLAPMQQPAYLSYHRAADSQPVSLQPPPPHQLFPACLPQEITLPPSGHARPGQACLHMKTRSRRGEGDRCSPACLLFTWEGDRIWPFYTGYLPEMHRHQYQCRARY